MGAWVVRSGNAKTKQTLRHGSTLSRAPVYPSIVPPPVRSRRPCWPPPRWKSSEMGSAMAMKMCEMNVSASRYVASMSSFQPPVVVAKKGPIQWLASPVSQMGRGKLRPNPHGSPTRSTQSTPSRRIRIRAMAQLRARRTRERERACVSQAQYSGRDGERAQRTGSCAWLGTWPTSSSATPQRQNNVRLCVLCRRADGACVWRCLPCPHASIGSTPRRLRFEQSLKKESETRALWVRVVSLGLQSCTRGWVRA